MPFTFAIDPVVLTDFFKLVYRVCLLASGVVIAWLKMSP